jgi:predicted MPP superfamily phosphohydrolase
MPDNSEGDRLSIAIASDLHAFDQWDGKAPRPSFLKTTEPESHGQHPVADLVRLINQEALKADLLLCPGDLGDRANAAGIQYAWAKLHELGERLGSSLITATAGNHDLDSRYVANSYDAQGVLQSLNPLFPLGHEEESNSYWAQKFIIKESAGYRLVILNSSAYHGTTPDEMNHGRVAALTLSKLQEKLQQSSTKPVNLLLCHHHPQQHCELKLSEYDVMKNANCFQICLGPDGLADGLSFTVTSITQRSLTPLGDPPHLWCSQLGAFRPAFIPSWRLKPGTNFIMSRSPIKTSVNLVWWAPCDR